MKLRNIVVRNRALAVAGAFLFGVIVTMDSGPLQKREPPPIEPPPSLEHFAFGFNEVMADALWLRSIQSFDFCEEQLAEFRCKSEGWLYHMLNTATNLSTNFYMPLATGPIALAIMVRDTEGASKLFDKSVARFPNDPVILHRAVYQALYAEKDYAKAADLAKRAADRGAPSWLYSLSAHMYNKSGQELIARSLLEELKKAGASEEVLDRVRKSISIKVSEDEIIPKKKKSE